MLQPTRVGGRVEWAVFVLHSPHKPLKDLVIFNGAVNYSNPGADHFANLFAKGCLDRIELLPSRSESQKLIRYFLRRMVGVGQPGVNEHPSVTLCLRVDFTCILYSLFLVKYASYMSRGFQYCSVRVIALGM